MKPKITGQMTVGPEFGFRPDTKVNRWHVHMIFNSGGMGDYINYSAATYWVAKNCPWVEARLFAPKYLCPLLRDIHEFSDKWKVTPSEHFDQYIKEGQHFSFLGTDVRIRGINISHQFYNATGAHLMDVGFAYYASMTTPKDAVLPVLDYPKIMLPKELEGVDYVVIPTGNVHDARKVTGKHVNPLIDHIKAKGLVPVFLGKTDMLGNGQGGVRFPDDINYHEGIDLRDKTDVKQAAAILQHAKATVGLDCGLLHLAALMKDSRIVFGYNITSVEHREPRRNHGRHINVHLTNEELACNACQSRYRHMAGHWFDKCLYGDSKCVDMLFADNAKRFTKALDEILEG